MDPTDDAATPRVALVIDGVEVTVWHLDDPWPPDLFTIDALARLHLAARQLGCAVRVHHPPEDLCRLLELTGLAETLGVDDE